MTVDNILFNYLLSDFVSWIIYFVLLSCFSGFYAFAIMKCIIQFFGESRSFRICRFQCLLHSYCFFLAPCSLEMKNTKLCLIEVYV